MENKIIIIYQSITKNANTKFIAKLTAKELNCEILDVATNPKVNLELYNLVGFGSGIYFSQFGGKLKKGIKNIQWSNPEVCKPDAFIFSTQHVTNVRRIHNRFNKFLQKKAGITTISGWASQTSAVRIPEAAANLKEGIKTKIQLPKEDKKVETKN